MTKKEMSKEEFSERFPHLSKEMDRSVSVDINREDDETEALDVDEEPSEDGDIVNDGPNKKKIPVDIAYDPNVNDFLARCDTDQQALEIINYLEKRGEITKEQAESLRRRLKAKGVRSFGEKRTPGYYQKKLGK